MVETAKPMDDIGVEISWEQPTAYQQWSESLGIPIHRGYFIPDARKVELGWWPERECNAAILDLAGLENVSDVRIIEIPPGGQSKVIHHLFEATAFEAIASSVKMRPASLSGRHGSLQCSRRLLRLDIGGADHLAPLFGFVGNELSKVGR